MHRNITPNYNMYFVQVRHNDHHVQVYPKSLLKADMSCFCLGFNQVELSHGSRPRQSSSSSVSSARTPKLSTTLTHLHLFLKYLYLGYLFGLAMSALAHHLPFHAYRKAKNPRNHPLNKPWSAQSPVTVHQQLSAKHCVDVPFIFG